MTEFRHMKLLHGWYRVRGEHYFSNVKRERDHGGQWSADIRYRHSGDLRQYAGLWNTKREAVEEAEHLIARLDPLYIEGDVN